jgi:DnaA family protein
VLSTLLALSSKSRFSLVYVQGAAQTGKTHLGVHLVGKVRDAGRAARLIAGPELAEWFAKDLPTDPIHPRELVVLDDADLHLEGAKKQREEGLFVDLAERVFAAAGTLVLLGAKQPEAVSCSKQAKSRLVAGMHLVMGDPQDDVLDTILDAITKQRGLLLTESKRGFILRRVVRTVPALVDCVNRLEETGEGAPLSTSFNLLAEAVEP